MMNPIDEFLHIENPKEIMCQTCKGFGCDECNGEGFKTIEDGNTR